MRSIVYRQFRKELYIIKTLVLYIVKPTEIHTLGVVIYAARVRQWYTALKGWWYTKPVGLDKKILVPKNEDFLAPTVGIEPASKS